MSRRSESSISPLARTLRLLEQLTGAEKNVLFEYLKPEPAPRKKKQKVVTRAATEVPKSTAICMTCGNTADHPDHDRNYLSSHEFVAPSVGKKSRPPKTPAAQVAGLETSTVTAGDAVTASSAGGN